MELRETYAHEGMNGLAESSAGKESVEQLKGAGVVAGFAPWGLRLHGL